LEEGLGSEVELALLAVWLEGASAALEGLEEAVRRALTPLPATPAVEASAGPPVTVYTGFLAAPVAYDSGDFLVKSADPLQPRYTPEMVQTDPRLSAYHRELRGLLTAQFGGLRDGLVYERYLEREHRPDDADLDFLRRQGYLRFPIPKDFGGA